MRFTGIKIKRAVLAAAGVFVLSLAPAPTANAVSAEVLGAVLGAGIQYAQLSQQMSYYDNEGREAFFGALKSRYGVNSDAALNARLDRIMAKLSGAVAEVDPSIQDKPYNYFINTDTSFNAFCTLGHNMSVNTGMFSLVSNDDEIAVVLGHEMGHGQKNHVRKGIQNTLLVAVGAVVLTNGSALGGLITNYAGAVHVTKPQERAADKLAFTYITHSDYNPGACAAIWQRVMEKYGENKRSFVGDIFSPSDHPGHKERRDTYAKTLTEYSGGKVSIDADAGLVKVNGKDFTTPAPAEGMSAQERAFFVMGNLVMAYKHGDNQEKAWADGAVVMLGKQPVMEAVEGDTAAAALAEKLNAIK